MQIKILLYLIIYSCFARSSPLARPDVMPAGCPSGSSFTTTSRGSCLPSFTILATIRGHPQPPPTGEAACRISPARLLPSPGILLAVLHPLGGILHPATGKGHARHSSARRAVSRLNRSCRNELIGGITLIVNYLDSLLGWLLQVDIQSKILILSYLQG